MRNGDRLIPAQHHRHVADLITMLELNHIANARVASLAASDLKRLTLAMELASSPSLLFLDEPTTGLDSRSAVGMMQVLRKVASTGRTIVCSIHQPSKQVSAGFDNLLLLDPTGRQVYMGPVGHDDNARTVTNYFRTLSHPRPGFATFDSDSLGNHMAWVLQRIAVAHDRYSQQHVSEQSGASDGVDTAAFMHHSTFYADAYRSSQLHSDVMRQIDILAGAQANGTADACTSLPRRDAKNTGGRGWQHCRHAVVSWLRVLRRSFIDFTRSSDVILARLGVYIFLGVFFGLCFVDVDLSTYQGTQSGLGFLLGAVAFVAIIFAHTALTSLFERRAAFYRERSSQWYSPYVYCASLALLEVPYTAMCTLVFSSIIYWIGGLRPTAASFFFFFYLVTLVLSLCFGYAGLALAYSCPSLPVAELVEGTLISEWRCMLVKVRGFDDFYAVSDGPPQHLTHTHNTSAAHPLASSQAPASSSPASPSAFPTCPWCGGTPLATPSRQHTRCGLWLPTNSTAGTAVDQQRLCRRVPP